MDKLLASRFFVADSILIITLLVLIWQTWLLRKTIRSSTFQNIYDKYFDLDRLIIEYPQFQKYVTREEVYQKIKGLSDEELRRKSFVELVLDLCELIYYQKKMGAYSAETTYIERVMTNPHIREYWKTVRGTFKAEFVEYVNKLVQRGESD